MHRNLQAVDFSGEELLNYAWQQQPSTCYVLTFVSDLQAFLFCVFFTFFVPNIKFKGSSMDRITLGVFTGFLILNRPFQIISYVFLVCCLSTKSFASDCLDFPTSLCSQIYVISYTCLRFYLLHVCIPIFLPLIYSSHPFLNSQPTFILLFGPTFSSYFRSLYLSNFR